MMTKGLAPWFPSKTSVVLPSDCEVTINGLMGLQLDQYVDIHEGQNDDTSPPMSLWMRQHPIWALDQQTRIMCKCVADWQRGPSAYQLCKVGA